MAEAEDFAGKDLEAYSPIAIRNNLALVEYCRTFLASITGSAAGILGLTSLYGFIFYAAASLVMSVMLGVKTQSKWDRFFLARSHVWTNGVLGELFTFVLVWTFVYGMIHVF